MELWMLIAILCCSLRLRATQSSNANRSVCRLLSGNRSRRFKWFFTFRFIAIFGFAKYICGCQMMTDKVACPVIKKIKKFKGIRGFEFGIASNYVPNHLTRHRRVEANRHCHRILLIGASLSELCRFVWNEFMSRAKAHLQSRLVCASVSAALSVCQHAPQNAENRKSFTLSLPKHTHATVHPLRSLHCTPIEVPFTFLLMFSSHLPPIAVRIILTAFDFHSSAIKSTLCRVACARAEMRWARFRLDFYFIRSRHRLYYYYVECSERAWAGGLAFGWHARKKWNEPNRQFAHHRWMFAIFSFVDVACACVRGWYCAEIIPHRPGNRMLDL